MSLSREELLTAVEENPEAFFELAARHTPGARFERDEHMRRMNFDVPVPLLNGVGMARLSIENSDALIDDAIGDMNATGMPWSWQIGPKSTPFELDTKLHNHGLRFGYDMPLMVKPLGRWMPAEQPAGFRVVDVNDGSIYEQFIEVAQMAFGLPEVVFRVLGKAQQAIGFGVDSPVRNFLGMVDDQAVCTGTVFYNHGVAGIFTIGTPPVHRGNGYGSAITDACLADAVKRGYDIAFLQSSKMGFPVYERLGFQEICKLSVYVPMEP